MTNFVRIKQLSIIIVGFITIIVIQGASSCTAFDRKVRLSVILVNTRAQASEVMAKLNRRQDFGKLAQKYSNGPLRSARGDVGYFSKRELIPELAKVAFELEIGEVSHPIKTSKGFFIIMRTDGKGTQLTKKIPPGYRKDEDFQRHFDHGLSLTKESKWTEAIEEFQKATEIDPNHYELHKRIGIAYGKMQSFSQALHHLKESLRLNPKQEGATGLTNITKALEDAEKKSSGI